VALIKCYECKGDVSDKAFSCPHCGAPGKENVGTGSDKNTNQTKYYCDLVLKGDMSLEDAELEFSREIILMALQKSDYVQSRTAKMLNITRRILKYKMDKLSIKAPEEE